MTLEERIMKAEKMHQAGGNCAQAVSAAFSDLTDLDEKTLFKITEAFGLGMGCMEGTCGAISGAAAVIGYRNSSGTTEKITKQATYKQIAAVVREFRERNKALVCADLKGVHTGKVLCSCPDCIKSAVEITAKVLGVA